jgi:hypothetical protein
MSKLLAISIISVIALVMVSTSLTQLAVGIRGAEGARLTAAAPPAITGDDMYITWWTNKTGNDEVMFRASDDGGATFADKINLSNSTNADSVDAEIAADFNNVLVSWWERNATSNEPVARISNDNGQTSGSMLKLVTNGTIGPG